MTHSGHLPKSLPRIEISRCDATTAPTIKLAVKAVKPDVGSAVLKIEDALIPIHTIDGHDSTGFNFGAIYDINEHNHVLFSAGRGLQNVSDTNDFSWFVGFLITGP